MESTRRRVGRPSKAEATDTKAELLDAALRLFARNGFAGTSIRSIAREVGMSESALYAHFRDKQDIYAAALAVAGPRSVIVAVDELDRAIRPPAGPGEEPAVPDSEVRLAADPGEGLVMLAERLFEIWDRQQARQLASLIARDGLLHDATLGDGIESAAARLGEVFARWLADGRIRPGLGSPGELAYALLAPIALTRMRWLHADASPVERAAARERIIAHARLFAHAVLTPAPRR